jgi:hypothetical protein
VYKKRLSDWYETFQQRKVVLENYKTCGEQLVNETVEIPVASAFLSADYLKLKN